MIRYLTWLGALNFVVLQWFGVRLVRVSADGRTIGWRVWRWIVPLTGWWSDYRWLARRR